MHRPTVCLIAIVLCVGGIAAHAAAAEAPAGSSVAGLVEDVRGRPVADADVFVAREYEHNIQPAVSGKTDARGAFEIVVPDAAVAYRIRVQSPGLAARVLRHVDSGSRPEIVLEAGRVAEGVVLDRDTQQPIAGADVEANDVAEVGLFVAPGAGITRATSDGSGHFRLEGLAPGRYAVIAAAKGYRRGGTNLTQAERPVQILLARGGVISGVVIGTDGRPAAEAAVAAEGEPADRQSRADTTTDDKGRFTLPQLSVGSYRVLARRHGAGATVVSGVKVQEGRDAHAEIRLERVVAVQGRLVDPDGKPVEGQVCVAQVSGADTISLLAGECAPADEGGRFLLASLPPGRHQLRVAAPGFVESRFEIQLPPERESVHVGDLELDAGLQIRGRVVDRSASPVAGATVTVLDSGYSVHTGADGSFRLGALAPGAKTLWVKAAGFVEQGHDAAPGARLEVVLAGMHAR